MVRTRRKALGETRNCPLEPARPEWFTLAEFAECFGALERMPQLIHRAEDLPLHHTLGMRILCVDWLPSKKRHALMFPNGLTLVSKKVWRLLV